MVHKMFERANLAVPNQVNQYLVTSSPRLVQAMRDYWGQLTNKESTQSNLENISILEAAKFRPVVAEQDEATKFDTLKGFLKLLNDTLPTSFGPASAAATKKGLKNGMLDFDDSFDLVKSTANDPFYRNEVSYLRFCHHYYKHLSQDVTKYFEPAFVWNEFQAVIKGSIDAVLKKRFLTAQEYLALAEKRTSLLCVEERQKLYHAFSSYEKMKNQKKEYDLHDLTRFLYDHMEKQPQLKPLAHYVYVDEVVA
jgi:hypothetical protein